MRYKISKAHGASRQSLLTATGLLGAVMMLLSLVPVSATIAAEAMAQGNVSGSLPNLGEHNRIDNPGQIDRPDELASAQDKPHELSADDLAKELSNPNTPLSSLTFKQTYTSFKGDLPGADDQSSNVTLFQPVFPFPLGKGGSTNLFVRPGLAYVWEQPVFDPGTNRFRSVSGVADLGFDVAVGRTYDSGLVLVGGAQGTLPTGADRLSGDQWRLGPEFLVARVSKTHYWALFPSHQWDVSGGDRSYSTSQLEIFAGYYLPGAWTIYTDSKMTYDWKGDQATVPINLSVSKVTKLGNLPLKLAFGIDYFVEQNDLLGQDWAASLSITPVVPNFIYNALK